jgi:hypothetical protein
MSPNEMDDKAEEKYIKLKKHEFDLMLSSREDYPIGTKIRIVLDKKLLKKNRTNLSKEAYIVDGMEGNQYLIKSLDGSVDKLPFWKIIPSDPNVKVARTIKSGKRGMIEEIIRYIPKKNSYLVRFDEGTEDIIPAKNLREGNPLKLSKMGREYWSDKNDIPDSIKKWE